MLPRFRVASAIAGLIVSVVILPSFAGLTRADSSQSAIFPAAEWQRIAHPKAAGYCQAGVPRRIHWLGSDCGASIWASWTRWLRPNAS